MVAVFRPRAVALHPDQALHAHLTDARGHAARFHRETVGLGIAPLDPWIATDALLADASGRSIHRLLVGAGLDALAIAAAPLLVDQHDPVLRPLVDRVARTRGEACGIAAVIAEAGEVEEP